MRRRSRALSLQPGDAFSSVGAGCRQLLHTSVLADAFEVLVPRGFRGETSVFDGLARFGECPRFRVCVAATAVRRR